MKKLITILTLVAASGFANADGPKFKSYVEMQAERTAAANAARARFDAECKIAEENALAQAARAAQLKAEREEYRKKLVVAAAMAPKINVSTIAVAAANAW